MLSHMEDFNPSIFQKHYMKLKGGLLVLRTLRYIV